MIPSPRPDGPVAHEPDPTVRRPLAVAVRRRRGRTPRHPLGPQPPRLAGRGRPRPERHPPRLRRLLRSAHPPPGGAPAVPRDGTAGAPDARRLRGRATAAGPAARVRLAGVVRVTGPPRPGPGS